MKNIGTIINKARLAKNLTLRDLGEKLSITPGYISNIENNKRTPSQHVLSQISRELDLDIGELMVVAGYWDEDARNEGQKVLNELDDLSYRAYVYKEMHKHHVKLEKVLKESKNLYLNNSLLSEEQKIKMLNLLNLVFDSDEDNFPEFEDIEKEIRLRQEKEILDRKVDFLRDLVELGKVDENEFEHYDLDDIELDSEELNKINEPWRYK